MPVLHDLIWQEDHMCPQNLERTRCLLTKGRYVFGIDLADDVTDVTQWCPPFIAPKFVNLVLPKIVLNNQWHRSSCISEKIRACGTEVLMKIERLDGYHMDIY